jgi:hypothetical protein
MRDYECIDNKQILCDRINGAENILLWRGLNQYITLWRLNLLYIHVLCFAPLNEIQVGDTDLDKNDADEFRHFLILYVEKINISIILQFSNWGWNLYISEDTDTKNEPNIYEYKRKKQKKKNFYRSNN